MEVLQRKATPLLGVAWPPFCCLQAVSSDISGLLWYWDYPPCHAVRPSFSRFYSSVLT